MSWKKIPINKIFNFEKWTLQSSKNTQWEYDFITASSEWKTHSTYSHECEALVFAMAASWSLWRTHYVNGKFIASDLCFIITPKDEYKDKVNLKFYYRYFNAIREILVKALATGSAKLSINAWNFWKYEVIIGEIEEQNKLIEKLDFIISKKVEISEYIENNIGLSKKLKTSILQDAIHWKLVPQDPSDESASILIEKIQTEKVKLIAEWKLKKQKPLAPIKSDEIPYELPKGWEWIRLGDILELVEYWTSEKAGMDNSQIPVLRMGNIQNWGVDYTDLKFLNRNSEDLPKLYLKNQDLLFNRTNSFELVWKTGIYLWNNDEYTFAGYLIRLRVFRDLINPFYVNNYINSAFFRRTQIEPTIVQQCWQANYNGTKLIWTVFPLPPKNEQDRIVKKTAELIGACSSLDEQVKQANKRSEKLMGGLLEWVFRG